MKRILSLGLIGLAVLFSARPSSARVGPQPKAPELGRRGAVLGGELRIVDDDLLDIERFPLEHTDVRAEIVGNIARVQVTQSFTNPYDKKIEAVYVFPLPNRAAVDDMEIQVGERTIKGIIKRREEARRLYEGAKKAGHVAALLDQERPNIFTQSVANILPGNSVKVTIRYFERLPYEHHDYCFSFPMVVGPRFIPGAATSQGERGWSPDTTDVPDASRITPPVLKPGQRSGHDISLEVRIDAGTDMVSLTTPSHQVDVHREGSDRARIALRREDSIPNKDFVLRYRVDGSAPRLVFLPHRKDHDGYFLLLVQPEAQPSADTIAPKEMVFVVDQSGSMSGFPIEKVKEAMRYALRNLNSEDTFQIIRFSNQAESFATKPVPVSEDNIRRGLAYIESLSGSGGTIMLEGVRSALSPPEDPERLRIISFMTDGYIGNEEQILAYLQSHIGRARLHSFGIGSSVNRYLLDKMAELGRGTVEYILLKDNAEEPLRRFYDRIRNPYLTDIEIDWGGAEVADVYPERVPDLFVGQPIALHGRYTDAGTATVRLSGRLGSKPYEQKVTLRFPQEHAEGEAIATLWARARIEDLSNQKIVSPRPELVEEITQVALAHRLMSAYTSFVAVEERVVTGSEQPILVEVPIEMPEGVSYEGVFGGEQAPSASAPSFQLGAMLVDESRDAAAPTKIEPQARLENRPGRTRVSEPEEAVELLICRIEAAKNAYRAGEPIEIRVTFENQGSSPVQVPSSLSVVDGSARFQIVDAQWKELPHPRRQSQPTKTVELPAGGRVTLRLVLNGPGAYAFDEPGTYHIVLLGPEAGLPRSNTLMLRIMG